MYDIKIIAKGKERFKDLYAKPLIERQNLRKTDGYKQCLLDFNELIAAAAVYKNGIKSFFKATLRLIYGEIEIKKNIDDK